MNVRNQTKPNHIKRNVSQTKAIHFQHFDCFFSSSINFEWIRCEQTHDAIKQKKTNRVPHIRVCTMATTYIYTHTNYRPNITLIYSLLDFIHFSK